MSYFPAFMNLEDKKVIIIGGGFIASEKLVHLLDFTTNITLIAKKFNEKNLSLIRKYDLTFYKRSYVKEDIKGFDIIIAAVDDLNLQENIYFESRNYNCLCSCVDLQKYCDFIFPSYLKKGDLIISISTSGASPALAKNLRIYLEKIIPESITEFLKEMKEYRKTMSKGKNRMLFLENKAKHYIETWFNK